MKNSNLTGVFFCFIILSTEVGFAQEQENKHSIWYVEIEGNERYKDLVILKYIANQRPSFWKRIGVFDKSDQLPDEIEIRKDVIRIKRFYQRRGYPNVEVSYELRNGFSENRKILVFQITENQPIMIDSVSIVVNANQFDQQHVFNSSEYASFLRKLPFKAGRRYQPVKEAKAVGLLSQVLKNIGFIYATVLVEGSLDSAQNTADVIIQTTPGPITRISSIKIEGAKTLSNRLILRETGLKIGELYSEEKLKQAQRELFKHHLFRLALISIPEQPKDSTLDLKLSVMELPLRSFKIRGGIGDFDRMRKKISINRIWNFFRVQPSWLYRNLGGKGTQFSTSLKLSFYESYLSSEFLFPYVFNTKSSFTINPYIENRNEKAYSISSGGIINSLGYEYNRNLTGTFAYEFAINNEYGITNEQNQEITDILPDSVLNYNVSSFILNFYYANGLSRGEKGWIVQPYFEISGMLGESDFTFQKLAFDVRRFSKLTSKTVLATRAQVGSINSVKQDSLPADIEFYVGGTSSVRGYGKNDLGPKRAIVVEGTSPDEKDRVRFVPIGGKAFFSFNIELRQQMDRVLKGFGLAAFLDGGQVWSSLRRLDERILQYSTGVGVRYQTPIGPLRVDLAYKLNPTDFDLELLPGVSTKAAPRWRIHISIGEAF